MSASREKKQRQTVVGQGPTQAQIREQKEAASRKRQTVIYWIIGVVAVIAVTALLVWNSGIFQRNTIAATVGDTQLTVGEMQCYYGLASQSELYQQYYYSMMGATYYTAPRNNYDRTSPLGDQQIFNTETNQTYRQHWEESALTLAQQTIAINAAAKAANFTLSADGQKSVEDEMASLSTAATTNNFPNVASYLTANFGRYVTQDIYRTIITAQQLASEYEDNFRGTLSYDQADYDAYAQEHPQNVYSYDYRYAFISGAPAEKKDEEGKTIEPTDEEKATALATAKAKADSLVASVQAAQLEESKEPTGEEDGKDETQSQDEALLKVKEDMFNALVSAAVGPTSSYANPNSNIQSGVLGYDLDYYGSVYHEWLTDASRVKGDVTAIEGTGSAPGYHVVFFLGRYLNNDNTMNFRHILIQPEELKDDPETPDVDESKGREDDPETKDIDESTIPTDEQLAAAKAKAEDILAQYEAGEKTEAAFGTLANEHSSDAGSNTAGGLYTYVEKGDMVPGVDEWIFDPARQPGDTAIVSNVEPGSRYYGYHVVYFSAVNDPRWLAVAEAELTQEAGTTWLDNILEPYPAAWTDLESLTR